MQQGPESESGLSHARQAISLFAGAVCFAMALLKLLDQSHLEAGLYGIGVLACFLVMTRPLARVRRSADEPTVVWQPYLRPGRAISRHRSRRLIRLDKPSGDSVQPDDAQSTQRLRGD